MRRTLLIAALAAALAAPAAAQDLPAAEQFVRGLYAAYDMGEPDYLGADAPQTFSPALQRLIERVIAASPKDEVGALDGDPICDCQDEKLTRVRVRVTGTGGGRAKARVRFDNFGQPHAMTLDLVAVSGAWRVADVHTPDTPSLVAYLRDSLKPAHR